jgi:hypothetical protein
MMAQTTRRPRPNTDEQRHELRISVARSSAPDRPRMENGVRARRSTVTKESGAYSRRQRASVIQLSVAETRNVAAFGADQRSV